jgi:hypothetical protein
MNAPTAADEARNVRRLRRGLAEEVGFVVFMM